MFQTAEIGRKVSKQEFKERELELRQGLLQVQRELQTCGLFQVIVDFAGVDGAGKGDTVNLLNGWMDPRWLVTHAYGAPSDEERERPLFWRYWRDLPPKGRIGLFQSSRYSRPLLDRVYEEISEADFDDRLTRIMLFEHSLAEDGALLLKFWMHLSRSEQKKRLKALEDDKLTAWQVADVDWDHWKKYDRFIDAAERIITRTGTGRARWTIVEGSDRNYRSLTVGETLLEALRKHLDAARERKKTHVSVASGQEVEPTPEGGASTPTNDEAEPKHQRTVLSELDMSRELGKSEYNKLLRKYQIEMSRLQREAAAKQVTSILVFEGMDAAGKGGATRRLTAALDARHLEVLPFAAPTDEERAQHYLWRFWRCLPRAGEVCIFDRSWYGRVLVERVEGFASEAEWRRAYAEINDFEAQLVEHGMMVIKFWMHITADEQLERFRQREQTPHKRWKLTDEDWRNREKWDQYELAAHEMVQHTSVRRSPWILVAGNDKRYARIEVLKNFCQRLEAVLEEH